MTVIVGRRTEDIGPIRITIGCCRKKQLLRTDPSGTIPPLGSFLDLEIHRTYRRTGIGSRSRYRYRSAEIGSACGRDSESRIYRISDKSDLRSGKRIPNNIIPPEFKFVISPVGDAGRNGGRQIIGASRGGFNEVPYLRASGVGRSIEIGIRRLVEKRVIDISTGQIAVTYGR